MAQTKRYAAKLLWQFHVGTGGKIRICEERIIVLRARTAEYALQQAKREGRAAQVRYRNDAGDEVRIEFVGVMELLLLDLICEENEVWYEMHDRLMPMERKHKVIPKDSHLNAIMWERRGIKRKRALLTVPDTVRKCK